MSTSKRRTSSGATKNSCAGCSTNDSAFIWKNVAESVAMLLTVAALYLIIKRLGIEGPSLETGKFVSLGAIVLVGLAASVSSCLALVGGLLLSVSAAWCDNNHSTTHAQKFTPLFLFNVGRLVGYFILGGLVAEIGQSLNLSIRSTGLLTIALALVMLALGLKMLQIIPKRFCTLPLPKRMRGYIRELSKSKHPFAALLLGVLTFFIPCGFTQSVQLLALGSGSFLAGGSMMLAFALGTLPALLGISALSAFSDGTFGRFFFKFSGAIVVVLGILNVSGGLTLTGFDVDQLLPLRVQQASATSDPNVTIDSNGQQIISVYVTSQSYSPASFTVKPDKPTWVYAIAPTGVSGCASMLTAPAFNMSVPIKQGVNWLGPMTPKKDFVIACSMGMLKANIHVEQEGQKS